MGRARIQIVEDEAIIAADIEESLIGLYYDVVGIAANSKEALEIAQNKKPDLILMDINIEGSVDGIDTAAIIKREHNIPVVFLTAIAETAVFNRAKQLEPQAYIMKPFRQLELRTVIELALHKHSTEQKRAQVSSEGPQIEQATIPAAEFKDKVKLPQSPSNAMKQEIMLVLQRLEAFRDLPIELLQQISEVCFISSLTNFQVFVHEGRVQDFGFVVESGRAAIFKRSPGGKELVVELIGPQDLFGVLEVVNLPEYAFSARSQGESRIMWIPREVIQYLCEYYPAFNKQVIALVLERLRHAHDFSRALAHDRVELRVASTLLALEARFGDIIKDTDSIEFELTRMELAELVGTTPETISRVFAHFVEDNALNIDTPGRVRLLSRAYFEKLIKG